MRASARMDVLAGEEAIADLAEWAELRAAELGARLVLDRATHQRAFRGRIAGVGDVAVEAVKIHSTGDVRWLRGGTAVRFFFDRGTAFVRTGGG